MKNKKLLASLLLAIFSVFVLIACKEEKGKYTVNFEVNGGSSISAITTDGNVTRPADPTREGYEFVGWYEDIDLTDPFDFETETVDSNTTLYAKWSEANPKPDIADKFYTVAELIDMCADYTDAPSNDRYYVIATVIEISDAEYGQMTIEDETGEMLVYGTYSADGEIRYSELTEKPVVGDQVILYGTIQQYGETPEIKSGWIIWFNHIETRYRITFETNGGTSVEDVIVVDGEMTIPANPTKDGYTFAGWYQDSALTKPFNLGSDVVTSNMTLYAKWAEKGSSTDKEYYTIAELIEMCNDYVESPSEERFYVEATIVSIDNPAYGQMTIEDGTGQMMVYGTYGADGEKRYPDLDEKPVAGDTVVLYANIQLYGGKTPEIYSGWIISFESNQKPFDPADYKEMTISEARNQEVGTKVMLEGVVASITVNANHNPIGFILVDETGSIYIYDAAVAVSVKVGNKIQVAGSRDNWILDKESSSAAKFGYDGCIQLANCTLLENDKGDNEWDKSWVEESTVKTLVNMDPSDENITSKIFKVNALVKEVPGHNFTNFYFFDIDETSGTYTYTQASGDDFTWLREFDGKVCTVYLMVLNYKSSSAGVLPRFLPIEVIDENYKFDLNTTTDMVMEYYVADNFKVDTYYANPALELPAVVSNATLGFENVSVTYTASDNAITFTTKDNKTVMNIDATTAKDVVVKVEVKYNDKVTTKEYTIKIRSLDDFDYISVTDAINAEEDTTVVVRGIVGPSLVNRVGFYLMDDEAMIAIITTEATLATLSIGDEVIIQGRREHFRKDTTTVHGQTSIVDVEVLVNLYGDNEIPTDYFIKDKNLAYLADVVANDINVDHTTEVYVVKATINFYENQFYSKLNLTDGDAEFELYMSNANQYGFLLDYKNQEVTMAIAPCNWNDKNFYKGCVLYIQLEDGTIIYNDANFS